MTQLAHKTIIKSIQRGIPAEKLVIITVSHVFYFSIIIRLFAWNCIYDDKTLLQTVAKDMPA
jgi:hypothetical protein